MQPWLPKQISGQELLTKIIVGASFNPFILGMRIKGSLDLKAVSALRVRRAEGELSSR
jgi:hypothetical protein